MEIGEQAVEDLGQFLAGPIGDADEEIVAADMAEEIAFGEEIAAQECGEERDRVVALVEAVVVVERLEVVEVAVAEEARAIAVKRRGAHEIADGAIAGQAGQRF